MLSTVMLSSKRVSDRIIMNLICIVMKNIIGTNRLIDA